MRYSVARYAEENPEHVEACGGNERLVEGLALERLIASFGAAMSARLLNKLREGKTGWDDPDIRPDLVLDLQDAVEDNRWTDVGNLSAMLWNLEHEEE